MDCQVFLVRPALGANNRSSKGITRILRISDHGISLSALNSPVVTEFSFERISNVLPSPDDPSEFTLQVSSSSGMDRNTLKLCCDYRTALLTALVNRLDDANGIGTDFTLKKHSQKHGGLIDTMLRVRSASIVKMVNLGSRNERQKVYSTKKANLKDILKMETLVDDEHVILLYFKSKVMRLSMKDSLPFLQTVQRNMKMFLESNIEIKRISTSVMIENISTYAMKARGYPVLYQFEVKKRLGGGKKEQCRMICITREQLVEKSGDDVVSVHSLSDILGLIVSEENPMEVIIESKSWRQAQYFLEARDSFIASLIDVAESMKLSGFRIHVRALLPFTFPAKPHPLHQNECEMYYINQLLALNSGAWDQVMILQVLKEFASNIHVGDSQCTDPRALKSVTDILQTWKGDISMETTCCLMLQSLLASRPCFEAAKNMPEMASVLLQCMQSGNAVLTYLAAAVFRAAVKFAVELGPAEGPSIAKMEIANRVVFLNVDNLQRLVALLRMFSVEKNNTLQIYGMLELFSCVLSLPVFESELEKSWLKGFESCILSTVDVLCLIFTLPSSVIFYKNSLFLRAFLTKTSLAASSQMQKACLNRCVIFLHLSHSLFSLDDKTRALSANLMYLMMEGSKECRKLLQALLPMGVMDLYAAKVSQIFLFNKESATSGFSAWMETLDVLRMETLATPVLVWNDTKRLELRKFLQGEVESFYGAAASSKELAYNFRDVQLTYASASDREGSIVGGIHLELLVEHSPVFGFPYECLWKLKDPLSTFQSVFQAMVLGFTPLFGNNNLPDIDLRLAAQVLTWIYERHPEDVSSCLITLNVIEVVVGMLREVFDSEHQVFVFKLLVLLLATMEIGGRDSAVRFVRAGGASVLVPLMVLSLAKCSTDKHAFESDAWHSSQTAPETVQVRSSNGQIKNVRVPSGRSSEVLDRTMQGGSLDAKEAIHWQDDTVHDKIQLGLALDLLESVLRFFGSDSSMQTYPPSVACFSLSKEELLCHLVQTLLQAKGLVFGRILDILSYVVKMNVAAMSQLYKLGAFEILLWKLLAGDMLEPDRMSIVSFIQQCHFLQDVDTVFNGKEFLRAQENCPSQCSILRLYLPDGLVLRLFLKGPDSFLAALDTESNTPEVIWTTDMRQQLLDYLTNELEPFVKFRATDPLALYIHVAKAPLSYPELADSMFTAPFYLKNLLDTDRFPNYQVNDPVGFHNSLMEDLQRYAAGLINNSDSSSSSFWMQELPQIHVLLQAEVYLLEHYPEVLVSSEVESAVITLATPALQTCMSQKDECPTIHIDILQHTIIILRRYCAGILTNCAAGQATSNFALSMLSLGTRLSEDGVYSEHKSSSILESAVADAFLVLALICSSKSGKEFVRDDIRWRQGIWCAICAACGDIAVTPARGPSPVAYAALNCLKHFADDEIYWECFMKQAWYLPLLLLVIPSAEFTLKAHDSKSAVLYSAADVLGSLVHNLQKIHGLLPMCKLIPSPLLASLEEEDGPGRFISLAASDVLHPTAIWTADVRTELRLRAYDRLQNHHSALFSGSSLLEDELEWMLNFEYDCLRGEMLADGLYIRGLASGFWDGFNLPKECSFLMVIQDYIEQYYNCHIASLLKETETPSHELSLDGEVDAKDSNIDIEDFVHLLAALKECIKYSCKVDRDDIITNLQFQMLSNIVFKGGYNPKVQIELASIIMSLAEHQLGRMLLLKSELITALARQLWQEAASSTKNQHTQVLMATLEAVLHLSENIPATVPATNSFATSGLLLPILALFSKVKLPDLSENYTKNYEALDSDHDLNAAQLLAAQILGQLLLAGSGISRREKLLKDLSLKKIVMNGTSHTRAVSIEGIEEATDMYKLLNIVEQSAGTQIEEPLVIKTLLLLFPVELLTVLARDPSKACDIFEGHHWSPRLVWDKESRLITKRSLEEEVSKMRILVRNESFPGIPSWSMLQKQPVFLRWVLATIVDNDDRPFYRETEDEDYAQELYLGGFFVDQFLRNPEFDFGIDLEERFFREVRKAIVVGAPTERVNAENFNFDDKRRLLLSLLLLFKLRPSFLLRHSNVDIFLPVYNFVGGITSKEWRGLIQIMLLLFHCTAMHSDIVDCMSSEELMSTLSSLLDLYVPPSDAGFTGTDPRLCAIMLIIRLTRLSSTSVDLALHLGIVSKLAAIILDGQDAISHRVAECLAIMCNDKRKGLEVTRVLERLVSKNKCGIWSIPLSDIRDEILDSKTLKHFLQYRYPSSWWS